MKRKKYERELAKLEGEFFDCDVRVSQLGLGSLEPYLVEQAAVARLSFPKPPVQSPRARPAEFGHQVDARADAPHAHDLP